MRPVTLEKQSENTNTEPERKNIMGLDQYLTARRYVSDWEHEKSENRAPYAAVMAAIGKTGFRCEGSPHLYVEVSVAYWRKANQIHAWFVENVQDGKDDCGNYYVERAQLETLRDLCETVLKKTSLVEGPVQTGTTFTKEGVTRNFEEGKIVADPSVAIELLPTQSGFFFGGTDYDQWYVEDLRGTVAQITSALAEFEGWDFQYHSSW